MEYQIIEMYFTKYSSLTAASYHDFHSLSFVGNWLVHPLFTDCLHSTHLIK